MLSITSYIEEAWGYGGSMAAAARSYKLKPRVPTTNTQQANSNNQQPDSDQGVFVPPKGNEETIQKAEEERLAREAEEKAKLAEREERIKSGNLTPQERYLQLQGKL